LRRGIIKFKYYKDKLVDCKDNIKDLEEVPEEIKDNLEIIPVALYSEIYKNILSD